MSFYYKNIGNDYDNWGAFLAEEESKDILEIFLLINKWKLGKRVKEHSIALG